MPLYREVGCIPQPRFCVASIKEMKMRINKITYALALGSLLWAGSAMADTLISVTPEGGGAYTQTWRSSGGGIYFIHCDAAGNCWGGETRKEK
jgi:hypothetical protein